MVLIYFLSEHFSVLVCAGSYTTADSLSCEPLADLMNVVQRDKPDLLVLVSDTAGKETKENEKELLSRFLPQI